MQRLLDNRIQRQRPAGFPDQRHPVGRERRARRRDDDVVGIAFGWRQRRADRVAQRGGGGPEADGALVAFSRSRLRPGARARWRCLHGHRSDAGARDFRGRPRRRLQLALTEVGESEIGERRRRAPAVAERPGHRQALLVQRDRFLGFAQPVGDAAEIGERAGFTEPVAKLPAEERRSLRRARSPRRSGLAGGPGAPYC